MGDLRSDPILRLTLLVGIAVVAVYTLPVLDDAVVELFDYSLSGPVMLGMAPRDLMRKKESPYKELGLADENLNVDALVSAMVDNPILIERPIVVRGDRAVLGRPPENVLALL